MLLQQPEELWERHLTGWVAFSCRASFHSYKMFDDDSCAGREEQDRQGAGNKYQELSQGTGMRKTGSSLGMGAWRRRLLGGGDTNASTQSLSTASMGLPVLARLGEALSNLG